MTTAAQLQAAEKKLEGQLRKVRAARGRSSERDRDALRKRETRLASRLIQIPTLSPADRAERLRREADDELWIESYWSAFSPDPFYALEPQQRQMVADFAALLSEGGDRATAASRGEGKTTLAIALTLKAILQGGGHDLWVLLGATAKNATDILETIRTAIGENDEFFRYYPEVCKPVRALENTVQRAKTQVASGTRHDNDEPYKMAPTHFHWTGDRLVFPNVPGSPSAGAIVIAQGLDSALRGMRIKNRRPRAVIIDDPDIDEALDIETPILTSHGFKRIADVAVGDVVYGTKGQPCNVIGTSEVKIGRICYRVTFDDGAEVICDAGHLWTTSTALQRTNRRRKKPDNEAWSRSRPQCQAKLYETVRTTQEIYETLHGESQRKNHSIEMQQPLHAKDAILPLDPYVFGVWLGDGTNRYPSITSADEEIIQQIASAGHVVSRVEVDNRGNKAKRYVIPSIKQPIRQMGMMHYKKRIEKGVPDRYLLASECQRLALLQGLMDTDGSIDPTYGRCVFANTNKNIIDAAVYLCDSLGIKCRVHAVAMSGKMKLPAWKVEFTISRNVFRLPRKLKHIPPTNRKNIGRRYVQSVCRVESRPVKCIEVDSEDHLFLCTKRLIPTHNTVHNPTQAAKLLRKIDRNIAALGSQRNPVSRLVLCTCASRVSAAFQLTDQEKYPSFRGRRMRFLLKPPTNQVAWAEFVSLCKRGWTAEVADVREAPIPRVAHEFYLSRRDEMDAGGEIANPHRYDHRIRPEGGMVEVSALEHYHGWVARIGPANTATEFDNDPPDELGLLDLTTEQIRDSRSGSDYRVVPPGTVRLIVGGDVKKLGLHWVSLALDERCVGSIVEFHFWRFATAGQRPEACEHAVLEGLRDWWQWIQTAKPWREDPDVESSARFPDWVLIDSGWKDEGWSIQPVSVFASEVGFGRCLPCKGFGRYRRPQPNVGIRQFDECHIDRRGRSPLCEINADVYKNRVQEAFKADFGTPGSLGLHAPRVGADGRQLRSSLEEEREFAAHIVSEQWDPAKAKFLSPSGPNHYLDATALARVGASLCRLSSIPSEAKSSKPRRTLAEMARG